MVNTRRIIRKTHPARLRRMDDQVWPLVIAFCVLGGFLAGTVLAYLQLDDPRWYANAWTYLIAIPLVIAASLITLAWTGNRLLRRSMQLAVVLCTIFHIVLFIVALETDVFRRVWTEVLASTQRPPEKKLVEVPQYSSWHHDPRQRLQREFSKPVDTDIPDPIVEPTPRETPEEEPAKVAVQPQAIPDVQPAVQPNVLRREQTNQSVPRQREQSSKLSRRQTELTPHPSQAVPVPDLLRQPQRQPDVVQPGQSGMPKEHVLRESRRAQQMAPATAPQQDRMTHRARKEAPSESPPQSSSAATLPRSERRAETTPRADIPVAQKPAAAKRNEPTAIKPNNTLARKQQSQAEERREPVTLPRQVVASELTSQRRDPQQPAPRQDTLAQTPRRVESRRRRITSRPDLATQAELAARHAISKPTPNATEPVARSVSDTRAVAPGAGPEVAPSHAASDASDSQVLAARAQRTVAELNRPQPAPTGAVLPGRRAARATALGSLNQRVSPLANQATARSPAEPVPSAVAAVRRPDSLAAAGNGTAQPQLPSVSKPGAATAPQVAQSRLTRREAAAPPSLRAAQATDQLPRRAMRQAQNPATPTRAENPVPMSASATALAAAVAPSSMVLNKARTGIAGRGAEANLGLSAPAAESPANVASGAAQRAQAEQNVPTGPALTPHAPALVRDTRADQRQPNAVLKATPLTPATLAGSRRPGPVNASASAALTHAAADAQRGPVSAAKGSLEVDLGPTTRVAQAGSGRASGGGQPRRSPGSETHETPRSARGRAPSASLLADDVRPTTAAPLADGGGEASLVELNRNPNAAIEARAGAAAPTLGGPMADSGGTVAAPTRSLMASSRRAAQGADGPQLSEAKNQVAFAPRKSTRDRQLNSEVSVADLSAGNAEDRNDQEVPSTMWAASSATTAVPKQTTGRGGQPPGESVASSVPVIADSRANERALAARAEAVDARQGSPVPGGGVGAPARAAVGPPLAVNTLADTPEVTGAAVSSGRDNAEPQSTQGPLLTRLAGGVDVPRDDAAVGAAPAEHAAEGNAGIRVGSGLTQRAAANSEIDSPEAHADATTNHLAKRVRVMAPSASALAAVAPASPVGMPRLNDDDMEPGPAADAPRIGAISRLAGAAMPVMIDAVNGPGGLERQVTVEVGIPDRRAAEISDQVQLNTARFARQQVGGMPDLNTAAAVAAEPFRRRARRGQGVGEPAVGMGPETEEAIELGLVYLSQNQTSDGRWTLDCNADRDGLPQMASDTAATGLALLAFQGAGYNHREFRYASVVRGGVDFLVGSQQPNGDLYVAMDGESNRVVALYSHSIAALALCEAFGMTQDPQLRRPAQKALDYIVQSQHPSRGGWRYAPRVGSDTSVTGWMMMALKSGELANLEVPDDTYVRIREWLDRAQVSPAEPYLYCYNPYAPDTDEQRAGRKPTYTMTSVGLLMRLYSGWRRDNPNMVRGAEFLLEAPPALGSSLNPRRDTYYWYYATQVMFHMGGQYWNAWNQRLHPLLVNSQIRKAELAGSWDPRRPVPDRWAPFAGRLYVTTMNLLSLEVTYRYLPLYEDTAR